MEDDFVPIEDVVGPRIHYHIDPLDAEHIPVGRVVVLQESTGLWAVNEKAEAQIKKEE